MVARSRWFVLPIVMLCGGCHVDAPPAEIVQRDTLASGAIRLAYPSLPERRGEPVISNLRIGLLDGDSSEVFGDVRSVEVDGNENIYVLDHQASEVRVFDADGRHLRNLTREGEGPGELVAANGMTFSQDGILWIHDHGQWQMIGVRPDGQEVDRVPVHVQSFGWFWSGSLDHDGRFWKGTAWPIGGRQSAPEEGVQEGRARLYMSWYDPTSGATDSVFMGTQASRSYVSTVGGYRFLSIPFESGGDMVVDPAGGFWSASREDYRLVRMDQDGDTLLIVDVAIEPEPVTSEDRERFVRGFLEDEPDDRRTAEALIELAPDTKPVVDQLFLDDEGRLWVRRFAEAGHAWYDVFNDEGEYLTSVELGFEPVAGLAPRVRNGSLYAVVADELGLRTVVRAALPEFPDAEGL